MGCALGIRGKGNEGKGKERKGKERKGNHDSEILHEPSLDTIIKIQREPNCLYVSQSVSWLTSLLKLGQYRHIVGTLSQLLTLCHIEATLRREGSTGTDTPALQGYHHSPPPSSPLISSAFALWASAELYILGPSLPFSLSFLK